MILEGVGTERAEEGGLGMTQCCTIPTSDAFRGSSSDQLSYPGQAQRAGLGLTPAYPTTTNTLGICGLLGHPLAYGSVMSGSL